MSDSHREIENLLYTYAARIDAGDLEGVAELFTHGRIQTTADAPPDATLEGKAAALGMYQAAIRIHGDGTPRTKHATTNAIIEVDESGESAVSSAYYSVSQATDTLALQTIITGRYKDTFTRIDQRWWFDTRIIFVDQVGDLSQHLLHELPADVS